MKLNSALLIVFYLLAGMVPLLADGSPIVQSLYAKGNYIVIPAENLYMIHNVDGKFSWEQLDGRYQVSAAPNGDLWSFTQSYWGSPPIQTMHFDGQKWTQYVKPQIDKESRNKYINFNGRLWLVAPGPENYMVLYVFDSTEWKYISQCPVKFKPFETAYLNENKIELSGYVLQPGPHTNYLNELYDFDPVNVSWEKIDSRPRRIPEKYCKSENDYKFLFSEKDVVIDITSPNGKKLCSDDNNRVATWLFDSLHRCYVVMYADGATYDKNTLDIWTDTGGEWEKIAQLNETGMWYVTISDDGTNTIWYSDGSAYLAFMKDGKWIEVAFMPPKLDCSCGPDDTGHSNPMLEAFPNKKDMLIGTVHDPDGYVNVRSGPGIESPITAIILEKIEFLYKPLSGNSKWSKVILPSGSKGYVSTDRIVR